MNCPECGGAYVLGGSSHARCRDARAARETERAELVARVDDLERQVDSLWGRLLDLENNR